ncbi:tetratricopeptide repeat protein [Reichenbachiella agarivorans]|uniref:Tetratricopeptide repeat protein n=1 Tax=Reichenbachiella agarivorans TaxID=2979464 RepID=A0ABY6CT34_9BACT|nr:tetratricopeptide repeat protein [Reichenbachiella agarivorans]UXP33686.1 tetratricopeptide repeat protein [Reichenbachiella agarivorans]
MKLNITLWVVILMTYSTYAQDCTDAQDCFLKAVNLGNTTEAIAHFYRAEALMSDDSDKKLLYDILSGRGNVYYALKDYTKALQNFNKLIQLRPEDKQVLSVGYSNRGNVMSANDNIEGAIASYTKAIEVFPPNIGNLHNRANAYMKLGKRDECLVDLKRMADLGSGAAIYYLQTEFNLDYSEQQKAALAKDSQWQEIQAKQQEAEKFLKEEKYQEANDLYIVVGDLYRARNDNEHKFEAWTNVAHVKNLKKDHIGAITFASMVINSSPSGWAYTELALANYYQYGMSAGLNVCEQGLKQFPKSSQLINFYTYLCRTAAGQAYTAKRYEESYGFYYTAYEYNTQDATSVKFAGHSAYSAGYYSNALDCYRKAVAVDPSLSTELKQYIDYCRSMSN